MNSRSCRASCFILRVVLEGAAVNPAMSSGSSLGEDQHFVPIGEGCRVLLPVSYMHDVWWCTVRKSSCERDLS